MVKKEKKAICLVRVSTAMQHLESQTEKVMAAAKNDGYADPILIENKESAVKKSESESLGINEMKRYIEAGNIAAVYCYELSRLSRRPRDLYVIRDYLIEHKVQLVVLNPSFKLLDAEGRLDQMANIVFGLFGSFAEQECMLRAERCKRGKLKKKEQGRFTGGKVSFGYGRDKDDYFIINPTEANVVKRIFNMYVGGKNRLQITRELRAEGYFQNFISDVAAHSHVDDILHNADYTGLHGRPQIISKDLFDWAQEKLRRNKGKVRRKTERVALCRGIMFNPKSICHRKKYYVRGRDNSYYCLLDESEEKRKFIDIPSIDNAVWSVITRVYAQQRDGLNKGKEKRFQKQRAQAIARKIEKLTADVNATDEQLMKIEERIVMGKLSEERAEVLEQKIIAGRDAAKAEIEKLRKESEQLSRDGFRINNIESLTGKEKEELVARLVEKIDLIPLSDKKCISRWKYCIYFKRGDVFMDYIYGGRQARKDCKNRSEV